MKRNPFCYVLGVLVLIGILMEAFYLFQGGEDDKTMNSFVEFPKEKEHRSQNPVTIVSGLWAIKSKRPFRTYLKWAKNFLAIDSHMVLFIDPTIRKIIEPLRPIQYRNRTVWVEMTLKQFETQKYRHAFEEHWKTDIEKNYHTVELYMVWAEKLPMLKRAIEANPFHSTCFYWTDFGCFRNDPWKYLHWPGVDRCIEDPRVVILKIRDFSQSEIASFKKIEIQPTLFNYFCVGGGIFGGRWDYVLRFHKLYFEMVDIWIQKGLFIGKDQNIMTVVGFNNPNVIQLIGPEKKNLWFYLEDFLLPNKNTTNLFDIWGLKSLPALSNFTISLS